MSRIKKKSFYIEKKLIDTLKKKKNFINIFYRNAFIIPQFVGLTFNIHNGKIFTKLFITEKMIGHRFGEFSPTRKKFSYKKKK